MSSTPLDFDISAFPSIMPCISILPVLSSACEHGRRPSAASKRPIAAAHDTMGGAVGRGS